MTVPAHLDHLRRDRHGRPVPFINSWSSEDDETGWVMRHDPLVGRLGIFTGGRPGRGTPNFKRQHIARQRECMVRTLCQVCAQPAGPDAVLVMSRGTMEQINVPAGGTNHTVDVFTEPWLCPACAEFVVTVCPALIRRSREDDLQLVRPERTVNVASVGWVEGRLAEKSRRLQPVMWVKVAIVGPAPERA